MTVAADRARDALSRARPILEQWQAGHSPVGAVSPLTDVWGAVASVLHALVPTADGQDAKALVAALRQEGLCTLDEAHALIDLHSAAAREEPGIQVSSELHVQLVSRAAQVLERIVGTADAASNAAPLHAEYSRASASTARGDTSHSTFSGTVQDGPPIDRTASARREGDAGAAGRSGSHGTRDRVPPGVAGATPQGSFVLPGPPTGGKSGTGRSSAFVVALVVVCLVAAGVAAVLFSRTRGGALAEGVEAYQAGQRVVARMAFERALAEDPSDALPLVYLGRLSREEGDIAQARRLLEQAVQRAPENPLTHRELGSALLADGQPELARRFYVRALGIDPNDRLAQGFLGCSLARLGRVDEARRWLDRAGPGDWNACAAAANSPRPPGMP